MLRGGSFCGSVLLAAVTAGHFHERHDGDHERQDA